MKILKVERDNRKKSFIIDTRSGVFSFPYAKLEHVPSKSSPIAEVWIDKDLGNEAFSYLLKDGSEGTVHIDHVLEYNRDPNYMTELLLYKLTVEAKRHVESSDLSTREIIRRLRTSPAQYYRLLDPTNMSKSINKMVNLLQVLGCELDVVFRDAKEKKDVLVSV